MSGMNRCKRGTCSHHSPRARQLETLAAYCRAGDVRRAAAALGRSYESTRNTLTNLYCELEVHGALEALQVLGWLTIPAARPDQHPGANQDAGGIPVWPQ